MDSSSGGITNRVKYFLHRWIPEFKTLGTTCLWDDGEQELRQTKFFRENIQQRSTETNPDGDVPLEAGGHLMHSAVTPCPPAQAAPSKQKKLVRVWGPFLYKVARN